VLVELRRSAVRFFELLLFGAAPLLLMGVCLGDATAAGPHHSDFWTFWSAGGDVLHGHSPYPALQSLPHVAYRKFAPFVYPPITAFTMVPLALLPYGIAKALYLLLSLATIALALRLLGVRDWRCFGLVFACGPAYAAIGLGAVGPFLLVGVALAWRYRDRAVLAGLAVAYVISAKLFLWPLWFWLLRTRRYRAAAVAAGVGFGSVLASWAAIGFAGLREYPQLLGRLTELVGPHSYSIYALERSLGVANVAAERSLYALAFAALALVVLLVRDDRRIFVAVLAISLFATPILWPHYLVLLVVPMALVTRRLSPLWLALPLLWVDASAWSKGTAWTASLLVLVTVIAVAGMWRRIAPIPRLHVEPLTEV
jgi:Glycosyltransferase family 87